MAGVEDSPVHCVQESIERDNIALVQCVVPLVDGEGFEHGVEGKGESVGDDKVDEEHMGSVPQHVDDADHHRAQVFTEQKPSEGFEKGQAGSDSKYRPANIDDIIAR